MTTEVSKTSTVAQSAKERLHSDLQTKDMQIDTDAVKQRMREQLDAAQAAKEEEEEDAHDDVKKLAREIRTIKMKIDNIDTDMTRMSKELHDVHVNSHDIINRQEIANEYQ